MLNLPSRQTNISKICRTCLQNSSQLKSIWDSLEETSIGSIVTDLSGIEVVEDSDLPNQICQKCLKELSNYVQFRKQMREADTLLRQTFKIKTEFDAENLELLLDFKTEDSLEKEINANEKDGFETQNQTSFERVYVMDIKPPESNEKNEAHDLKPSVTQARSRVEHSGDEAQLHDSGEELKTATKTSTRKFVRTPDELEQKTFNSVQLTPGRLICCSCFHEFTNLKEIEQHVKAAHPKHLRVNSSIAGYTCNICFRGYTTQQGLNTHNARIQQMTSLFECKICKFRCWDASKRMAHAKAHDKPDKLTEAHGFICCAKMCNESFATEELLLQHAPVAHKVDKIQAELAFYNKTRPVQCNICYGYFPSEKHVTGHRYRKYIPKRKQCSTCGESFNTQRRLDIHEGTHLKEKTVVCEICSKRFYTKVEMNQHLRHHVTKPRFVCDLCGKIFDKSSLLQAHVLAHEGKLPYVCEVCNRAFAFKTRLVYHMRTHTGKPFQCKFCDARFTQKCRVRTHELKKHTMKKNTDDGR